jgi:endonuclease YncB( thermonuclease family)
VRFGRYRRRYTVRSHSRRILDWVVTFAIFALMVFAVMRLDEHSAQRSQGIPTVVDGDSLVLRGAKLRLEGIDAPEYLQMCKNGVQSYPCGREAQKHLEHLIAKRQVECKGWQNDKYGRLLVRCFINVLELNRQMVSSGWAVSYGDYFVEETSARTAKRGVWQGEFQRPSAWRKMHGDIVEVPHDTWLKFVSFIKSTFGF